MTADTDTAIARYTAARHAAARNAYRAHARARRQQMRADAPDVVARIIHDWNTRPTPTPTTRPDWRVVLDARISHCPTCDEWVFDGRCARCDGIRQVAA